MIRKSHYQVRLQGGRQYFKNESTSTDSSQSPRLVELETSATLPKKQKLQLCKKFIANGQCPYSGKCKFAHGSHQLRKNNHKNSLYKTKQCVVFFKEGCCHYGDRCNFLHERKNKLSSGQLQQIKSNFKHFFEDIKSQSRLMQLIT